MASRLGDATRAQICRFRDLRGNKRIGATMRINGDRVIAGLPAIKARHLIRRMGEYITPIVVRQIIGCPLYRAKAIVAQLEAEGYITPLVRTGSLP